MSNKYPLKEATENTDFFTPLSCRIVLANSSIQQREVKVSTAQLFSIVGKAFLLQFSKKLGLLHVSVYSFLAERLKKFTVETMLVNTHPKLILKNKTTKLHCKFKLQSLAVWIIEK